MRRTADGLWYRPGDKLIVDEVRVVYDPIPVEHTDVLLDLGAHIGATSHMILRKGAAQAIAIEADPTNVPVLRRNLDRRARIIWAAVGASAGRVPFYVRRDRSYVGSVLPDDSRQRVMVPMVPLCGLLERYRPTILKCDIEFGEYALPELRKLPEHVRVLAMEVHIRYAGIFTGRKQTDHELTLAREEAAALIAAVEAQGFRTVRRKDKQAKPGEPPAAEDATGLAPMTKAVDAVWVR